MTSARAVAGISGIPQKMGTIHCPVDTVVNFEMPATLTSEHLRKVEKDLELIGDLVRDHPRKMSDMHSAIVEGRLADAAAIGGELGLHEHRFIAAGGGLGAAIPIIAGVLIVAMVAGIVGPAVAGKPPGDGEVGQEPHVEPGEIEGEGEGEGEVGGVGAGAE
jgi:hypothetical protein